jgi:hypothetical protein
VTKTLRTAKGTGYSVTDEKIAGFNSPGKRRKASKWANAILLYVLGLSMNSIARIYRVHPSSVLYWVRNFALKVYEKPVPEGSVAVELDEMRHYIGSKKQNAGCGRHIAALPANWLTGNAETGAARPLERRLNG